MSFPADRDEKFMCVKGWSIVSTFVIGVSEEIVCEGWSGNGLGEKI